MSEQFKAFVVITFGGLCFVLGFLIVGWWMLVPVALGAAWQLAGQVSTAKRKQTQAPHPSHVASTPSKPASTATWQQTVEAIERGRSGANDAVVKSDH